MIEIILSAALFMIIATGSITVILQGLDSNRLGKEQAVASQYAAEGLEATRSIKNQAYASLVNTTGTGIRRSTSNIWEFFGTNNILVHNSTDNYIRTIKIEAVNRDGVPPSGNVVISGGTLDPDTKKVTSTVAWNFTPSRTNSVVLTSYLSDWRKPITTSGPIMMVYSKTTNVPYYRIWDGTGWSAEAAAQTVGGNINYIILKSSRTRNEAILGTMDSNGNIYAQVWNGSVWGTPTLMATVGSTLAVYRSFDIRYEKS